MTAEEYRELLVQVLAPPGQALPRDPDSWFAKLCWTFAEEMARFDALIESLAAELDPRTASELLPEWEAMAGLPDPCVGQLPTLAARRGAVLQRLAARGRLTAEFVIEAAAALGFTITITEYSAFVAGTSEIGEELADQDAYFVWDVESTTAAIFEPEIGSFTVGDPLGYIGDPNLSCLLDRIKPAHTLYNIVIGGP